MFVILFVVSVFSKNVQNLRQKAYDALDLGADIVELRLDYLKHFELKEIQSSFEEISDKIILTNRAPEEGGMFVGSDISRVDSLLKLVDLMHPRFFDIEFKTIDKLNFDIEPYKQTSNVIVSWHDVNRTPSYIDLKRIFNKAQYMGDVIKIVPMANSYLDNAEVLKLYSLLSDRDKQRVVSFCMGLYGVLSRFYLLFIDPFLYYTSLPGEPIVEGQFSITEARGLYNEIKKYLRN